jgi:hypothetical protein
MVKSRAFHTRVIDGLEDEITRARRRFGLGVDAPVAGCCESGRDGFWIHRFRESVGVESHVVDLASNEEAVPFQEGGFRQSCVGASYDCTEHEGPE